MARSAAATSGAELGTDEREELVKEACTMALYVAICLLAALWVVADHELERRATVFKII